MEMTERDNFACCPVCRRKNWAFFFKIGCLGELMHVQTRSKLLVEMFFPLNHIVEYEQDFNEIKIIDEQCIFWGKPDSSKLVHTEYDGATPVLVWERIPGIYASVILEKIVLPKVGNQAAKGDRRHYFRVSVDHHTDYSKFESINPLQKQKFEELAFFFTPKLPKLAIDSLMLMLQEQMSQEVQV